MQYISHSHNGEKNKTRQTKKRQREKEDDNLKTDEKCILSRNIYIY